MLTALDKLPAPIGREAARDMKLVRKGWFKLGYIGAGFDEEKEKKNRTIRGTTTSLKQKTR